MVRYLPPEIIQSNINYIVMKILRITVKAKPEKEIELKQALKSALAKTYRFEGVKHYCSRNWFEEDIIHIELEWKDSATLKSYINSKEFQYLTGAITVLGELVEQKIINALSVDEI